MDTETKDASNWRQITTWTEMKHTLLNCSVVVGLHADQATGAIVDFAVSRNLPFAVVPCCVYSNEFPRCARIKNFNKLHLVEKFPKMYFVVFINLAMISIHPKFLKVQKEIGIRKASEVL
jgi:hypothetical protein